MQRARQNFHASCFGVDNSFAADTNGADARPGRAQLPDQSRQRLPEFVQ
jgi:hypothetical protein